MIDPLMTSLYGVIFVYIFSVDSEMWPECDFYGRLVIILGIVLWRVGQTGTHVKAHVQYSTGLLDQKPKNDIILEMVIRMRFRFSQNRDETKFKKILSKLINQMPAYNIVEND